MFDTSHIHPMIVHFPIALLIVGFLFELVGIVLKKEFYAKTAFYLLILGTLGVIAAYISGNIAGDGVSESGMLKNALEVHEEAAFLSLLIMISASIVRIAYVLLKKNNKVLRWLAFVLFLSGVISIARTGYYGGELVFKHAAGVQFNFGFGSQDEINSNIGDDD